MSDEFYWNHRVIEFTENGETWRAVHEVYYEDGKPWAFGESPAKVLWYDGESPYATLQRLHNALAKPVLTPADFTRTDEDDAALIAKLQAAEEAEDAAWLEKAAAARAGGMVGPFNTVEEMFEALQAAEVGGNDGR